MRFDRMVSTGLVWPAIRGRQPAGAIRIPMLMYHSISRDLDRHRSPYFRTVTSPETFAAHLRVLTGGGFEVVTLSEAVQILAGSRSVKPGTIPVVITFDDGFLDFYSEAFPLLQAANVKATVFLATACLDGNFPTGDPCLTSQQVRELSQLGIEFGSHSETHVRLVEQSAERLEDELKNSKTDIEELIGSEVTLFSFPFRFPEENRAFTARLHERLLANGYRAGVTTVVGRATPQRDLLFLPRLPVNDCDDEEFFRAKLGGAYDWFGPVQLSYKKTRAALRRVGTLVGAKK